MPVGLISSSYGGSNIEAWMTPEALKGTDTEIPADLKNVAYPNRVPTVLFNGMINPILGYGISGIIWYQGEANCKKPENYATFNGKNGQRMAYPLGGRRISLFTMFKLHLSVIIMALILPFYVKHSYWAMSRIHNAAMVINMDAGSPDNIHPPAKIKVGERLAYMALSKLME
ncbi:MAG: sialate O-acetylesterase [Mangrovibacterium sp.]